MIMVRACTLSTLFWGCTITIANNCLATNSNSAPPTIAMSSRQTQNDVSEVGWVILTSLERMIDVRCGILTLSIRRNARYQMRKECCAEGLWDAELSEEQFLEEIQDLFRYANSLIEHEGFTLSNALKELSRHLANRRDFLLSEFIDKNRPPLTSPPEIDYSYSKLTDVRDVMTNKEKYRHMVFYAHFKTVVIRIFSNVLAQNMRMKNKSDSVAVELGDNALIHASKSKEAELDFVFSVITNKSFLAGINMDVPMGLARMM
jgi:hypothetical protein